MSKAAETSVLDEERTVTVGNDHVEVKVHAEQFQGRDADEHIKREQHR